MELLSLTDGSFEHISKMPLLQLSIEDQDKFGYFYARHYAHNDEFFIELPPALHTNRSQYQYGNVDLKQTVFAHIDWNLMIWIADFLSLPSWILHEGNQGVFSCYAICQSFLSYLYNESSVVGIFTFLCFTKFTFGMCYDCHRLS